MKDKAGDALRMREEYGKPNRYNLNPIHSPINNPSTVQISELLRKNLKNSLTFSLDLPHHSLEFEHFRGLLAGTCDMAYEDFFTRQDCLLSSKVFCHAPCGEPKSTRAGSEKSRTTKGTPILILVLLGLP